jgi:co-chaperonin GroES (HSP10)
MVKSVVVENVTKGGIIIPDKALAKMKPARGEVITAGKDNKFVKVGDMVLFSKENCFTDTIEDEDGKTVEYVFVKEEDICIVSNREHPDL